MELKYVTEESIKNRDPNTPCCEECGDELEGLCYRHAYFEKTVCSHCFWTLCNHYAMGLRLKSKEKDVKR